MKRGEAREAQASAVLPGDLKMLTGALETLASVEERLAAGTHPAEAWRLGGWPSWWDFMAAEVSAGARALVQLLVCEAEPEDEALVAEALRSVGKRPALTPEMLPGAERSIVESFLARYGLLPAGPQAPERAPPPDAETAYREAREDLLGAAAKVPTVVTVSSGLRPGQELVAAECRSCGRRGDAVWTPSGDAAARARAGQQSATGAGFSAAYCRPCASKGQLGLF